MEETRVQSLPKFNSQLNVNDLLMDLRNLIAEFRLPASNPQKKQLGYTSSSSSIYTSNPHLPPLPDPPDIKSQSEFPKFDGTLLHEWFRRSEEYFTLHNTPPEMKVRVVAPHMIGKALQWHTSYIRDKYGIFPSWYDYIVAISAKFGDNDASPKHRPTFNHPCYKTPYAAPFLPPKGLMEASLSIPNITPTPHKAIQKERTKEELCWFGEKKQVGTDRILDTKSSILEIESNGVKGITSTTMIQDENSTPTILRPNQEIKAFSSIEVPSSDFEHIKNPISQSHKCVDLDEFGIANKISDPICDELIVRDVDLHAKKVKVLSQQSSNGDDKHIEHQLFDEILLSVSNDEKQRKSLKTWKFKFKTKDLTGVALHIGEDKHMERNSFMHNNKDKRNCVVDGVDFGAAGDIDGDIEKIEDVTLWEAQQGLNIHICYGFDLKSLIGFPVHGGDIYHVVNASTKLLQDSSPLEFKFAMEKSARLLLTVVSYGLFHSPRPPELSCYQEAYERILQLNSPQVLMHKRDHDYGFSGCVLMIISGYEVFHIQRPPEIEESDKQGKWNVLGFGPKIFILEDKDVLNRGVLL